MYGDSLDALRTLITKSFPEVERLYVSTMPDSFIRPSFFITLATANEEHLNRAMYETNMTWQIVYFAPLLTTGEVDVFNQLNIASALKNLLMEQLIVTGPSGSVYHILDADGGTRDEEVYMTVRLQTEFARPREESNKMLEIHLKQKEE